MKKKIKYLTKEQYVLLKRKGRNPCDYEPVKELPDSLVVRNKFSLTLEVVMKD